MNKYPNCHFLLVPAFIFSCVILVEAQGIKGTIRNNEGEVLSFASIVLVQSQQGIASNLEGEFSLNVPLGKHRLRFQFLGYKPLDTIIEVGQGIKIFNPVLKTEIVELGETIIGGKGEDPAYTIMRRAIAKAKYHSMQVDNYHAMVYVKGSGRLIKVPGLMRKKITQELAKEGIDSTVAFTQESVSKLHYIRPNQYSDTVISIRTTGSDNNTSPMGFIYSSFYEAKVGNGISPLAPDAFNHYRYEYLGFIEDAGQTINKIKVIPKGKGDQVFEGIIYIVDNVWSLHSLDLTTYLWGIEFDIQQQFDPVLPDVWLPVHEIYDVSGSLFGFGFEYRYFAKLSDYDITLNPDLEVPVIVLDAKVETEAAAASDKKWQDKNSEGMLSEINPGEELSVKQLRKMMRDYEKKEIEALPEIDTIPSSDNKQVIDSTAYRNDSAYWDAVRPMPLTDYEVKGYERQDSMAAIPPEPGESDDDSEQDTVRLSMGSDGFASRVKRREKFSLSHLITGGRYRFGDHLYLQLKAILQSVNYNTVDGFYGGYELEVGNRADKKINWAAGPLLRYNAARETFNYEGKLRLFGKGWSLRFNGGEQTRQFNTDTPLSVWSNTGYTLLANKNYLKQYEQIFFRGEYNQSITRGAGVDLSAEIAKREKLVNHSDIVFFDNKKLLFTSNDPVNISGTPGMLENNDAFITGLSVWLKPFWKYKVTQGTKRKDYTKSPSLTVGYKKGWGEDLNNFNLISGSFRHKLPVGAGSLLSMNINAGKFIGDQKPFYFHDYAHFPGSRMISTPLDPVSTFRMLDYYLYSTNDQYAYGLFNYQFRRFALTQFDVFRRQGLRENILFNTLLTQDSQQYMEVGYAINYILRIMRIEFVTSWQDYRYQDFAVRFGIATDFESIFGF